MYGCAKLVNITIGRKENLDVRDSTRQDDRGMIEHSQTIVAIICSLSMKSTEYYANWLRRVQSITHNAKHITSQVKHSCGEVDASPAYRMDEDAVRMRRQFS